ncbi:MAG: hypothetical protein JNK67_03880, partial [Alphaproteobacteria bacterium]|nr:hypothetical protein [Alphaproteobacteria bacterium]
MRQAKRRQSRLGIRPSVSGNELGTATDFLPRQVRRRLGLMATTSVAALFAGLILATPVPADAANFVCDWTSATSSTWNIAGNWSACNSTFPNNGADTFDARILVDGVYTVTLSTNVTVNSLVLDATGANINHNASTLTLAGGGPITITSGTYNLNGGTISGATIQQTGTNRLVLGSNGGLTGVTLRGDLVTSGGTLAIASGLTLLTEAGAAPGTANLTNTSVAFTNTQTFNNATVNLSGSFGSTLAVDGNSTLTLGAGAVVQG